MISLEFSNRFEVLVDQLVSRLDEQPGSVFEPRVIVIPSAAIRRRVTLELARRQGICANLRFVYLAQWLWELAARVDPSIGRRSPFDAGTLTWHIHSAFGDRAWRDGQGRLARYLEGADDLMRYELASQVATVFLDYATYRNPWLEAWQRGKSSGVEELEHNPDQAWQASLWRRIAGRLGMPGRNPLLTFAEALGQAGDEVWKRLPGSVDLFCLPDISPLHLDVLRRLGSRMELHVQAINPCGEYWFEVVDATRLARLQVAGRQGHHEVGQRLLAAWGRQSQAHLGMLFDRLESAVPAFDFRPAASPGLLATLQNSILDLDDLQPGSIRLDEDDRSIEVHDCHSRGREIEVLHDRLLALFARHPDLGPSDVLVVTPDLESSAPLIEAVFGSVPKERHIALEITGLPRSRANPLAGAMLALLGLARSRWNASEVMAFIEQPPVARRLELSAEAIERIRSWLRDAGVRWGLDADDRERLELPAIGSHSFEDGLQRLFLGYAMPAGHADPFLGRLPAGDPEGADALTLGVLADFVSRLTAFRDKTMAAASARNWSTILSEAVDDFLEPDREHPEDLIELQAAIARLAAEASGGLGEETIPVEVVSAGLARLLDDPARGGVPGGAVTFSSLSSLRTVPFPIVCMIGMDDGDFPSNIHPPEYDLIAKTPQPGDRQRRIDDRGLFLDHLLAARRYLHISYIGHGIRDNSIHPPSVLVAELIDWISTRIAGDPDDDESLLQARHRVVVEQPLQAFSERAFKPESSPRIASFNQEFAAALNQRRQLPGPIGTPQSDRPSPVDRGNDTDESAGDEAATDDDMPLEDPARPFFVEPLGEPPESWRIVDLSAFFLFFRNPSRYLLDRRLGIGLPRGPDALLDDEPFVAGYAQQRSLSERLLPALLGGIQADEAIELAIAGTDLPGGAVGRQIAAHEVERIRRFAERVRDRLPAPPLASHSGRIELDVDGEAWRLVFSIDGLGPGGLVRYRDADAGANDYLEAWLNHLVLSAQPAAGCTASVSWMLRDADVGFDQVEQPESLLTDLMRLYRDGLRQPLEFFPKSAWAYAEAGWKPRPALAAWTVNPRQPYTEGTDPWYRLALRGRDDPLFGPGSRFDECARRVFAPLRQHLLQRELR